MICVGGNMWWLIWASHLFDVLICRPRRLPSRRRYLFYQEALDSKVSKKLQPFFRPGINKASFVEYMSLYILWLSPFGIIWINMVCLCLFHIPMISDWIQIGWRTIAMYDWRIIIYDVFLRYVEQITFLPDEMSTTLLCFIWMTWKQANPMKFPLLLKAAFGGGGRGQAVVANEACKGLHLQRLNLRRFPHSFVWSRLTLQKSLRNVARRLKWALS